MMSRIFGTSAHRSWKRYLWWWVSLRERYYISNKTCNPVLELNKYLHRYTPVGQEVKRICGRLAGGGS